MHGERVAQIQYQSHAAAIDTIDRIARTEEIECDFARVDGYLFLHEGDPPEMLVQELAAAQLAGDAYVRRLERTGHWL